MLRNIIEAVKPTRPILSSFLARRSLRVPIASSKVQEEFEESKWKEVVAVDPVHNLITLKGAGTFYVPDGKVIVRQPRPEVIKATLEDVEEQRKKGKAEVSYGGILREVLAVDLVAKTITLKDVGTFHVEKFVVMKKPDDK